MPSKDTKVAPHRHCPVCGKAMDEDAEFCSTKCKEYHVARAQRQKKFNRLYYVSFGALLVLMAVFLVLSGL